MTDAAEELVEIKVPRLTAMLLNAKVAVVIASNHDAAMPVAWEGWSDGQPRLTEEAGQALLLLAVQKMNEKLTAQAVVELLVTLQKKAATGLVVAKPGTKIQ